MSAAEIVRFLAQRGHTITIDGPDLVVRPAPASHLLDRLRQRKPDVVAYLRELGEQPATAHRFVALREVAGDSERATRACCIACGNDWSLHGEPPTAAWRLVDDANDVALIDAAAIVAGASVDHVLESSR